MSVSNMHGILQVASLVDLGNARLSRFFAALQTVELNHEPCNVETDLKLINPNLPFVWTGL